MGGAGFIVDTEGGLAVVGVVAEVVVVVEVVLVVVVVVVVVGNNGSRHLHCPAGQVPRCWPSRMETVLQMEEKN